MQIVGFGGLAKAGKTTAGRILAEWAFKRGYHVVMDGFAAPLKQAAAIMGFHKGGDTDHLYRAFCQCAGAMARNEGNVDWFVKLMSHRLDLLAMDEQNALVGDAPFHETIVIIDDVRFLNEVSLLKAYHARTVFICAAKRLTDMGAAWRKHESEQMALDYTSKGEDDETFDFSVPNNIHSVKVMTCDEDEIETFPALEAYIVNMAPTLTALDAAERLHE